MTLSRPTSEFASLLSAFGFTLMQAWIYARKNRDNWCLRCLVRRPPTTTLVDHSHTFFGIQIGALMQDFRCTPVQEDSYRANRLLDVIYHAIHFQQARNFVVRNSSGQ